MVVGIDANIIALKWNEIHPKHMSHPIRTIASSIRVFCQAPFWIRDRQHGVWYVYAIALALVVFGFNWLGMQALHQWIEDCLVRAGLKQFINGAMEWAHIDLDNNGNMTTWQSMVSHLIVISYKLMYWGFSIWFEIKTLKYILLAFSGPLVSWVSEQTESEITGATIEFSGSLWARDMMRSLLFALVLFLVEITVSLMSFGIVTMSLVFFPAVAPILSVFALVLAVFLSSFVFGMASFDPIWERKGYGVKERLRRAWSEKWKLFGLGLPFHFAMAIPIISTLVAPIILPIISSVGAVLISEKSKLNPPLKATTV